MGRYMFFQAPNHIIACLQVYVVELAEPLLRCMWQLCDLNTVILLAYYQRSPSAHKIFWQLLPSFFYYKRIVVNEKAVKENASQQVSHTGLFQLSARQQVDEHVSQASAGQDCNSALLTEAG